MKFIVAYYGLFMFKFKYVYRYIHWPDKSYASWVVLLQNPFPLESFCQHDSGQFPPQKSFLVY